MENATPSIIFNLLYLVFLVAVIKKMQRKLDDNNVEAILKVENGQRKVVGFCELGPLTDYGQCEDGSGDFMPGVPHFTKRVTPKIGRPLLS